MMLEIVNQFHFIRPNWLFALLPLVVIVAGLMLKSSRQNQWTSSIDKHLLSHLLIGQNKIQPSTFSPLLFLSSSLLLAVLAIAGPTWEKKPLPVFETEISKVILLDLSLSMESTDVKPSRLIRAKFKISDLLSRTNEGQVALIVYAGDAFVISPLTTDANTILTMVPSLSPSLMPVLGSEPQAAFKLADELLVNAGVFSGQIIWITDGVDDRDYALVAAQLKQSRHQISILAVGTQEGAPIPLPDGQGFLKDASGNIVLPSLRIAPLEQLAQISSGTVTQLTADDKDIDRLLASLKEPQEFIASEDDLEMDTWVELGPWLLIPILFVTAFAFRKGVVVGLALILFIPLYPSSAKAAEAEAEKTITTDSNQPSAIEKHWKNLWQTPDQQAAKAFNEAQHSTAADLFEQEEWKSAALYKSGEYNAAADILSSQNSATSNYNRGNALAQSGRYEESIEAYDQALQLQNDMEDASYNKELVEQLLKQQQEQEQEQEQKDQQDGDQQENEEQQEQDGEQQDGEEEQSDSQDQQQDKQSDEQQEKEQKGEQEKTELEQMNDAEREQVLEQWLRMIKDDPGGLLRRKMYMEYQKRQQQGKKRQDKGEKVW
ncbi:MAG: Ca-activated chloride channel family protein [Enterobacterales bacterium]|jgi:Ca-activated chloride channel family protein